MKSPFESPKMRLRRAKEHLRSLEACAGKYFKKQPYRHAIEFNQDDNREYHKIVLTKAFPEKVTTLAVDAIESFRAALDQSCYACAHAFGKPNSKFASFPIADTEQDLENRIKGACKDLPDEILNVIRGFKPYKDGNPILHLLNHLCNTSKHRLIIPIGTNTGKVSFGNIHLQGNGAILFPKWDTEKEEMVFGSIEPGTKFDYNISASFYAAFNADGELNGVPAIDSLKSIDKEVAKIVKAIETKTISLIGL